VEISIHLEGEESKAFFEIRRRGIKYKIKIGGQSKERDNQKFRISTIMEGGGREGQP
jgi:predicted RNase H-related nuclease YkuK (DUF458 family)